MKHLTNREEEIMESFWKKGPMFVNELCELFSKPKLHYNTVSTIVRGLEKKGFLNHQQFGNTYRYNPVITREEFGKSSLEYLVNKYFNSSYASVITIFLKKRKISTKEIQKIIRQSES